MSIDLLPFNAFALESCAAPAAAPHETQTLTLPLRAARAPGAESVAGRLLLLVAESADAPAASATQHAGIVAPQEAGPLTITFGCSSDAQ
jgi:hypothetical protein